MKPLFTLSCISALTLTLSACASKAPTSTNLADLTPDDCKAHLAQFVPTQNKNDAALLKDRHCASLVAKK